MAPTTTAAIRITVLRELTPTSFLMRALEAALKNEPSRQARHVLQTSSRHLHPPLGIVEGGRVGSWDPSESDGYPRPLSAEWPEKLSTDREKGSDRRASSERNRRQHRLLATERGLRHSPCLQTSRFLPTPVRIARCRRRDRCSCPVRRRRARRSARGTPLRPRRLRLPA